MKVFHLVSIPDLKDTIKANDFVYNQKFVKPQSLLIPFGKRFPVQKDMPIQNPQLGKDATMERAYKFASEMNVMDLQLLHLCYQHAVAHDVKKIEKRREGVVKERDHFMDQHAIDKEVYDQRFTILRGWMKRFRMEKVFDHLKLRSMDEYKHLMQLVHHKIDNTNKTMHHLLLKQFNQDPAQNLTPAELEKITGFNEELVRIKINLQHHELLAVNEMQHRLAEQGAAEAMTRIQQNQKMLQMHNTSSHTGQAALLKRVNKVS